jgi:hypothetical protein
LLGQRATVPNHCSVAAQFTADGAGRVTENAGNLTQCCCLRMARATRPTAWRRR